MALSLSNIFQRPYVSQDTRSRVKRREDEQRSTTSDAQREDSGQNTKSKDYSTKYLLYEIDFYPIQIYTKTFGIFVREVENGLDLTNSWITTIINAVIYDCRILRMWRNWQTRWI